MPSVPTISEILATVLEETAAAVRSSTVVYPDEPGAVNLFALANELERRARELRRESQNG